jgi:hypothetical protein
MTVLLVNRLYFAGSDYKKPSRPGENCDTTYRNQPPGEHDGGATLVIECHAYVGYDYISMPTDVSGSCCWGSP